MPPAADIGIIRDEMALPRNGLHFTVKIYRPITTTGWLINE